MPLPELRNTRRRRTGTNKTTQRASGLRKVNLEDTTKRQNHTDQLSLSIQNARATLLKAHLHPFIEKLPNRKQIEAKLRNKSNFPQGKSLRNRNRANTHNLTSTFVPKRDVVLAVRRGEAGEPSVLPRHVPGA